MKFKQNQLLLITVTIILALSICKKNETIINPNQSTEKQIIEQFTKVPEGLDPKLNIVANKLKQLNESTIISWGNRAGVPIWEKAEFKRKHNSIAKVSDNDDEVVIIPLSQPNTQEIDGFLACNINVNNTNVNEFDKYTYANYGFYKPSTDVDAEDIVIKCLEFQNSIFGNTKFKILDNRLFNSQNTNSTPNKVFEISLSNEPQSSQTNSKIIITKHNHCIGHDGIGPNGHDGGDCDECDWCGLFSFDIILFDSPLDWGGGGNGGGNGLGGGGNGFSGGGWVPSPLEIHKNLITTQLITLNPNATFYFDDALNPNSCQNFNSVTDFANYLNGAIERPLLVSQTGNQKISKQRVWRGYGGYDFFVKTEKDAIGKYSVKDVTASEFGMTLSWSFSLTTYSSFILKPTTNPNDISVDLYGTESFNVFLEGIGTIYKRAVQYQMIVNAITGEITSFKKI